MARWRKSVIIAEECSYIVEEPGFMAEERRYTPNDSMATTFCLQRQKAAHTHRLDQFYKMIVGRE